MRIVKVVIGTVLYFSLFLTSCKKTSAVVDDNTKVKEENKDDDKKDDSSKIDILTLERIAWSIDENETIEVRIKKNNGPSFYDSENNPLNLIWSVSDESILSINQKGIVEGKSAGIAEVYVKSPDKRYSLSAKITVYNKTLTDKIAQPLSNDLIYSKGIYLIRNTVIQCFDVDSKGTIFYDQLGGGLPHVIFVARGEPNQNHSSSMQLKYFGHGTNMAIEEQGEDRYIWIGSNGHKASNGAYGSNKTFSRLKYIPNGIAENYEENETYYLPGKANIHPALDQKNDILAVTTSGGGDPLRYFYIYKMSEVKNLPQTRTTLPSVKFGGEESGVPEQTVAHTINVKDLSKLTPLAQFSVPPSQNKNQLNSYFFQGFDISDGKLYFYEGEGNNNTIASGPSNAYVTVFDYNSGLQISKRAKVMAIDDLNKLNSFGITATGYMEAEGIKMKNGNLYLGFASKSTDDKRRANVLIYKK